MDKGIKRGLWTLDILLLVIFGMWVTVRIDETYKVGGKYSVANMPSMLKYISGNEKYEIKLDSDINVDVYEQVQCVKAPCDHVYLRSYKVSFSEENENVALDFVNKMFEENNGRVISLNDVELNEHDASVLNAIILEDESYIIEED